MQISISDSVSLKVSETEAEAVATDAESLSDDFNAKDLETTFLLV